MSLTIKKVFTSTPLALLLFCSSGGMAIGEGFYTIIGPDGHPIVVPQRNDAKNTQKQAVQEAEQKRLQAVQKRQEALQKQQDEQNKQLQKQGQNQQQIYTAPVVNAPDAAVIQQSQVQQPQTVPVIEKNQSKAEPVLTQQGNVQPAVVISANQVSSVEQKIENKVASSQATLSQTATEPQKTVRSVDQVVTAAPLSPPTVHTASKPEEIQQGFTEIDGVKYVDNEYLEAHEFNLEGKKRFYVMPDTGLTGGRHFETVEREKGIGQTLIEKIQRQKPAEPETISLASTYYRLPKDDVVESLAKACFTGKRIDKAKTLDQKNQEVGFWPVPPLREDFAYEVVKLDQSIQDIRLTSYASSNKAPSFYWPLVVFLDQKGCVIEGVSGFKNHEIEADNFQHAALEGVLKKPQSAAYLFMTPLSSAVDAENKQLTNQGQVKLSVIR